LIVGAGDVGNLVAKRLLAHPEVGLVPVGFVDDEPRQGTVLPVLGGLSALREVIETYSVGHVVFAFSKSSHEATLDSIDDCIALGVRTTVVPRLFERLPDKLTFDYIGGLPLVSLFPTNPQSAAIRLKYAVDRVVAAAALLLLSPVLAAIAAAVAVSDGRPVFFRQPRVGRNGRVFVMLKFRTMSGTPTSPRREELSVETGAGGVEGADRRTRVGKFLRATSLDELPQLFNVVRGDMSLVGPRPERPELAEQYRRRIPRYADRERMKSGITGWAQIHGLRGKTSLTDRVEWDNWYIENCSPWLDFKILVDTTRALTDAE
jgi:exopolysaccharide biosynthesis polyprenyl glycosylphosphotransferase